MIFAFGPLMDEALKSPYPKDASIGTWICVILFWAVVIWGFASFCGRNDRKG